MKRIYQLKELNRTRILKTFIDNRLKKFIQHKRYFYFIDDIIKESKNSLKGEEVEDVKEIKKEYPLEQL